MFAIYACTYIEVFVQRESKSLKDKYKIMIITWASRLRFNRFSANKAFAHELIYIRDAKRKKNGTEYFYS